jgi:uncharacterized protein Yka (UPF0111/DUF47 family)
MRFNLIPREEKFFDMFDEAIAVITQGAASFLEMVTNFDQLDRRAAAVKAAEERCDEVVARIITALDRTFITPFDREDIHTLATTLDDIMDDIEATAYRLNIFRVQKPGPDTIELTRIIHECCVRLGTAIGLLRDMKNAEQIYSLLKEISELENTADRIYRGGETAQFAALGDAATVSAGELLTFTKWRELHGWLEQSVNACKVVANVLTEIVIKGT